MPSLNALPWPLIWLAEPSITPCSALRVSGSNVLKIWSRSTAVVVASCSMTPLSGIFLALCGAMRRSM